MPAWLKKLIDIIIELIKKKPDPQPQPSDPAKDTTDNGFDINTVLMHNHGEVKTAKITAKLTKITVVDGSAALPIEITNHNWQPNDGYTDAYLICFQLVNGQWGGEYLEHVRIGGSYTIPDALLNMYHNPDHKPFAIRGQPFACCVLAKNGLERTNALSGIWPIDDDGIMSVPMK